MDDLNTNQFPRAVILHFPRRRGRPKSSLPKKDIGTYELLKKREQDETIEPLDLCLKKGLIDDEQHWCGVHLRWLYTLRHGAPGVRAIDPTHLGGMELKIDDPLWRNQREEEYHLAIKKLASTKKAEIVMNICIYNEIPRFLKKRGQDIHCLIAFKDGLSSLVELWKTAKS